MRFFRRLFSLGLAAKQDPVRTHAVEVIWPTYGSPTLAQLRKLLRKFFDKREADFILDEGHLPCGRDILFDSEGKANKFRRDFCRLVGGGYEGGHVYSGITEGYLFTPNLQPMWGYTNLEFGQVCTGCGSTNPSLFRTEDGERCRSCMGVVKMFRDMKPKEVRKYVESAEKARSRDRNTMDEDFGFAEVG